ncbi:hypothetical protein ARA01_04190 [Leuconostoc mesenteroides subsp. mesenteroides]|nr:hypothetical protein [Leuconostoc mesenteroides]AQU49237.1 hypothetical protein ARA01_04190 [Leuconostoc mesenteroides subsp. mesenteroides]
MAYTFKDELKLHVLLSDFIFQLFSSEILEQTPLNSSQLKIASSIAYGIRTTLQKIFTAILTKISLLAIIRHA